MLLELMVYWMPEDYNPEEYENTGKKVKMVKDVLIVNTAHIVAIDQHHPTGETMVHLTNGEVFHSTIKFNDFRELLEEEILSKDMFVSGDN